MLFTSSANHVNKIEILDQFRKNQNYIKFNFPMDDRSQNLKKCVTKLFLRFFTAMLFSYIGVAFCTLLFFPEGKLYCAQYILLTAFIHAQSFQIFAYSKMISFQLKHLNFVIFERFDVNAQEIFRKALMQVFTFVDQTNKTFSAALLTAMFWLYLTFLDNLYFLCFCAFEKGIAEMTCKFCTILFKYHANLYS